MNNSYDVYMCRYEQIVNDAMSLIGKPTHFVHYGKYKSAFEELAKNGKYCRITSDSGDIFTQKCVNVEIFDRKPPPPIAAPSDSDPYFNGQTGTEKQIIRKISWVQRIFG